MTSSPSSSLPLELLKMVTFQFSKLRKFSNSLVFTFKSGRCFERFWCRANLKPLIFVFLILILIFFIVSLRSPPPSSPPGPSSSSLTNSHPFSSTLLSLLKSRTSKRDIIVGGFARRIVPPEPREFIRKIKDVIIICHPDWRGIRAATYGQDGPIVEVPGILDDEHRDRLTAFILETGVQKVVVNGVPPNFIAYAKHLHAVKNSIDIYFIFHGTLVQHTLLPAEGILVDEMIEGQKQGYIKRIGFVKSGISRFISSLGGEAHTVSNFQRPAPPSYGVKMSELDQRVHIGVFGDGGWIKNTIVQLAAACIVENAVIHVVDLPATPYFRRCKNTIVVHGMLPHDRFVAIVGQMDINLYISLSESYPMTVLESLVAGVPCLTSYTNGYLEKDEFLKHYLIARAHDNPDLIAQQIEDVLKHREELMPRIRYLLKWLNDNAQVQWDYFLERSAKLVIPPYKIPRVRTPTPLPLPPADNYPPSVTEFPWKKPVICFVTYELGSITPGGTGVVVEGMVLTLTEAGFEVMILGDLNKDQLEKWRHTMVNDKGVPGALLSVFHLETMVPLSLPEIHPNVFITKAQQFADGLHVLYSLKKFDVVEFHEYAGPALETVRVLGTKHSYVPPSVKVVLRVHGSLQLIDTAEAGTNVTPLLNSGSRQAMYLMEFVSMQYADRLLFQSEALKDLYIRAYGLQHPHRFLAGHPPMEKILDGFVRVPRISTSQSLEFLVFGKMQLVKGTDLILNAAVLLFRKYPSLPITFVFVGLNMMCTPHKPDCIHDYVPADLRDKFEFRERVDRTELSKLVKTAHAAIIASRFETFCMAAHELYTLGLPLVISDIPAFRDHFHQGNAFVFNTGNVQSLAEAILEASSSSTSVLEVLGSSVPSAVVEKSKRLQNELPWIDYGDPLLAYKQLGDPEIVSRRLEGYTEFELASRDIYVDQVLRITEQ